jgi:hypothetical protein
MKIYKNLKVLALAKKRVVEGNYETYIISNFFIEIPGVVVHVPNLLSGHVVKFKNIC